MKQSATVRQWHLTPSRLVHGTACSSRPSASGSIVLPSAMTDARPFEELMLRHVSAKSGRVLYSSANGSGAIPTYPIPSRNYLGPDRTDSITAIQPGSRPREHRSQCARHEGHRWQATQRSGDETTLRRNEASPRTFRAVLRHAPRYDYAHFKLSIPSTEGASRFIAILTDHLVTVQRPWMCPASPRKFRRR